ncbi:MAG: GntR family transcriptional regulator [Deltaproteobacteria bacterium]|nr:MAG: GntR family transcriptional regulator [Deltaproteobacteria bacterium]
MMKVYTKSAAIYEVLKADILNGRLRPGEKLVASRLAEAYGVSVIPVREALSRLKAEGLVTIVPHTGAYVTEIDLEDLKDLYPIRGVLEGFAARLACGRIGEEDFGRLEGLIEEMDRVIKEGRFPEMGGLNYEFHMTIYKASGNRHLVSLIDELWQKTARVRSVFALVPERAKEANEEHKEILSRLKDGDAKRVEELIIQQDEKALQVLMGYLEGNGMISPKFVDSKGVQCLK